MRIENAINEIRGPEQTDRRNADVKRRRSAGRSGDVVEISNTARTLGSQSVSAADLNSVSDVRHARVEAARQRVASGYYDRPEVREAIADAVLDSGVVGDVGLEARDARVAKEGIAELPDVRPDRVALAKQRVATSFYDATGVKEVIADRILDTLIE